MCRLHAGLSANEKVRSKKERGHEQRRWVKCFWERDRGRERESGGGRERDPIHINKQADTQKGKSQRKKKTGHIPRAPENVQVILGLVLLIDEWGVFKPLPLWSCFNRDCAGKQLNALEPLWYREALVVNSHHSPASDAIFAVRGTFFTPPPDRAFCFIRSLICLLFSRWILKKPLKLCEHSRCSGLSDSPHDSFTYINVKAETIGPTLAVCN